jgi:glycerol-3-phosphate acyltransferase PlsY
MLAAICLIVFAYLLGSIPSGYWITKLVAGVDIRTVGSGSTGTTNVLRTAGKLPALIVLIADIGKGYLPVFAAIYLELQNAGIPFATMHVLPPLCAIATIVGHSKSIFLNFKGGKSAATGLGTLLAMAPIPALCILAIWITVLAVSKIVSLASITAGIATPIIMIVMGAPTSYTIYGALAGIFVIVRHKDNIGRLLKGIEPKIGQKLEQKTRDTKSGANI